MADYRLYHRRVLYHPCFTHNVEPVLKKHSCRGAPINRGCPPSLWGRHRVRPLRLFLGHLQHHHYLQRRSDKSGGLCAYPTKEKLLM